MRLARMASGWWFGHMGRFQAYLMGMRMQGDTQMTMTGMNTMTIMMRLRLLTQTPDGPGFLWYHLGRASAKRNAANRVLVRYLLRWYTRDSTIV